MTFHRNTLHLNIDLSVMLEFHGEFYSNEKGVLPTAFPKLLPLLQSHLTIHQSQKLVRFLQYYHHNKPAQLMKAAQKNLYLSDIQPEIQFHFLNKCKEFHGKSTYKSYFQPKQMFLRHSGFLYSVRSRGYLHKQHSKLHHYNKYRFHADCKPNQHH